MMVRMPTTSRFLSYSQVTTKVQVEFYDKLKLSIISPWHLTVLGGLTSSCLRCTLTPSSPGHIVLANLAPPILHNVQ